MIIVNELMMIDNMVYKSDNIDCINTNEFHVLLFIVESKPISLVASDWQIYCPRTRVDIGRRVRLCMESTALEPTISGT